MKLNKVLPGYEYIANFMDEPVRLGMIYRMDEKQFIPALHFNDAFPGINLNPLIDTGSPGLLKFSKAKDVTITFGAGSTPAQVRLKFKRARSVIGAMQDATQSTLRSAPIMNEIKKIWVDNGYDKFRSDYVFVFAVTTAASGTLLYSVERNNEVVLEQSGGQPVNKIADLASGKFEYVSNSKQTLEIIRAVAHKPLFKAFYLDAKWRPQIAGA